MTPLGNFFCTPVASSPMEEGHSMVKGVVIQNKTGRSVIMAKAVIDATGDGDRCLVSRMPIREAVLLT